MISSQAMRASELSIRRSRIEVRKPRMIRAQSLRKKISKAMAVATCKPTRNAR